MAKRTIKTVVNINNKSTEFTVIPDGQTFQGYYKYNIYFGRNGGYITKFQSDDCSKKSIVNYLNGFLPTLFYNGILRRDYIKLNHL